MTKSTLSKESIKSIRNAINAVAKHLELSDYKRRQIMNSELSNPAGWAGYPESDNSEDACVQRYYDAIYDIYGNGVAATRYTNIFLDFRDHLINIYGVRA